jgi:fatty-acyl-CoA synthase
VSLVDGLREVAATRSGHGVHILRRGQESAAITYTDLYDEAGRMAAGLVSCGVSPDDRVALLLPTSVDFARAFFGVLAAGAVAVPLPGPPAFSSSRTYLKRTALALRRSGIRTVLAPGSAIPVLSEMLADESVTVLDASDVAAHEMVYVPRGGADAALVQYTSGTSADPRGVVLSHDNLAAGAAAIADGTRLTRGDIGCTWLPLFHDMGLIGSFLTPLLHDVDIHLQRPEDFLWDPLGWIRSIGRLGATFTMAPNSGYRYVLRRGGEFGSLDLSRWRIAVNGAEPVDSRLHDEFVARFGLRPDIFMPAYGLAEAALAVTLSPLGRPTKTLRAKRAALGRGVLEIAASADELHRELVSVGKPVSRTEIRLVGVTGLELPEGRVGRIEVRGASVTTTGYDRDPATTRHTLLHGGWIATGDLGLRQDGELYIVGREKETIIVFGVNHWASDIEAAVRQAADPSTVHGILAQQVDEDDRSALGLVIESTERDPAAQDVMSRHISQELANELGITPRRITYVRRGDIPRTSSGKIVRHPVETTAQVAVA